LDTLRPDTNTGFCTRTAVQHERGPRRLKFCWSPPGVATADRLSPSTPPSSSALPVRPRPTTAGHERPMDLRLATTATSEASTGPDVDDARRTALLHQDARIPFISAATASTPITSYSVRCYLPHFVKLSVGWFFISRPTPIRLLTFALCLEWINGIYNIPDTDCLECYRPHASVDTTTPARRESIASTSIVQTCQKYGHDIYPENSK